MQFVSCYIVERFCHSGCMSLFAMIDIDGIGMFINNMKHVLYNDVLPLIVDEGSFLNMIADGIGNVHYFVLRNVVIVLHIAYH